MTEQENRILFALIEPEGCFHKWKLREKAVGNQYEKKYACVICGTRAYSKSEYVPPDFTLPEWRIGLQEWLFAKENLNFWEAFEHWLWSNYTCGSAIDRYVAKIIPNLPSLLLDYLRTDEAKEKFGWVRCPGCDGYGVLEGQGGDEFHCKVCGETGKIKSEWLVELEK